MFFGGINGYNSFYPEDITINLTKAKPLITQFYLFNKPVKVGSDQILKKHISKLDEIRGDGRFLIRLWCRSVRFQNWKEKRTGHHLLDRYVLQLL